jgi:hypothetical protein
MVSLLFITNKFGDQRLQEPKSDEVIRSGTGRLPPAPARVTLVNLSQLRQGLSEPGKMDSDPAGDKADHTLAAPVATTDPIHQSSLEYNSEGVEKSTWWGTERNS